MVVKKITIILGLGILLSSCFASAHLEKQMKKKPVLASYTGGGKSYTRLVLFKDSTFRYITISDIMPWFPSKRKGLFAMDSVYISLTDKKTKQVVKFRIQGDKILLYSEAQERSQDGDFLMEYYTLIKD